MMNDEKNQFAPEQIERIKKRFNEHAKNGKMNLEIFKKSMGLLGIGECQFLCNRIFPLISQSQYFDAKDFLQFLTKLTYGSKITKAKISFDFLDREKKGYITKDDIEIVISEVSFMWNFLTGEKISLSDSIKIICEMLDINDKKSITFTQYLDVYDNEIDWYDYFNSIIKPVNQIKRVMNISQVEQYLKLLHHEIEGMIVQLKEGEETQDQTDFPSFLGISQISSTKGPFHLSSQEFKPRGDMDTRRESLAFQRASTLSRNIEVEGSSKLQVITNKLSKFEQISYELFPEYQIEKSEKMPNTERHKKKAIQNITEPEKNRQNIVYFGHQNWNLMLNMMLGLRNSLKSHFFKYEENVEFTEEDLICKYYNELIYKLNNKSIKEICELFVDYSPKVFFYIRKYFQIQNEQFLKSIGLQYLIGNLLMGNLSTLTDQTSQGKSGSFMYYTQDTKLIVKSISKQQYRSLKNILGSYASYTRQNPNTFLLHIYGLHKLTNKLTNRQIYFIVVNNFFETPLHIDQRYDLKGSTYNRHTLNQNANTVLKDVDLINNHNRKFSIKTSIKQKIYNQILKDIQFLSDHNLTEFSLLVGIHKSSSELDEDDRICGGFLSNNRREVFYFGIIDIFTEYSTKKVLENHVFHIFNSDISCLPPQQYNQRFKNFIYKYIFSS